MALTHNVNKTVLFYGLLAVFSRFPRVFSLFFGNYRRFSNIIYSEQATKSTTKSKNHIPD